MTLEEHRKALNVAIHDHAGILAENGWTDATDGITVNRYRSALHRWLGGPVAGAQPAPKKPKAPQKRTRKRTTRKAATKTTTKTPEVGNGQS